MSFSAFLKYLFVGFVEAYQEYFRKTFTLALILSLICFLIALLLMVYTNYDKDVRATPASILSFFFSRYSYSRAYRFVDVTKTVFVFLVSMFSISIIRNNSGAAVKASRLPFKVGIADVFYLFWILIACILFDCELFKLDGQIFEGLGGGRFCTWVLGVIFQLRIYLPLVAFALVIRIRTSKSDFRAKEILFLLVSLWLCNEVVFEFILAVRSHIFELVLSPVSDQNAFFICESILGFGLIALVFPAYYWAMTAAFKMTAKDSL